MSTQNSPTRFKNALTWPETQSITSLLQVNTISQQNYYKSTKQRVPVKYTLPTTQPFTAGSQTTQQQIGQGLGYAPMLALTEPLLGFGTLACRGFGLRPNPGENLATMFLRNRTDIKAKYPPVHQIVPSLAKTCNSRGTLSTRELERCQLPTRIIEIKCHVRARFSLKCGSK